MKKFFAAIIFFSLAFSNSYSQTKIRTSGYGYIGIGYKFTIFTNADVDKIYPIFNFFNSNYKSELNAVAGIRINERIAIELNPSLLLASSQNADGFYFTENNVRRFYVPQTARLIGLPINLKLKIFPFSTKEISFVNNIYAGVAAGAMYLFENYDNTVYTNENRLNYVKAQSYRHDFWNEDFEFVIGILSGNKIDYGFELGYRFVPLGKKNESPVITSIASNLNSVNLSATLIFSF